MKKIYLSLLAGLMTCQFASAQNLTQSANEPIIGDVSVRKGFDSTVALPKNTGMNQTWNFSTVTANTVTAAGIYTTAASTPSASSFPLATLAEFDGTSAFNYYRTTGSNFELLGIADTASGGGVYVNFSSNPALIATWPVSFGYNTSDAFSGTAAVLGMTGTSAGNMNVQGSGTGTVQLPGGGTFNNVLQVKMTQTINLNLAGGFVTGTITSTEYQYYHSTQKFPIITVSYQTTNVSGNITNSADIYINNAVLTGLNDGTLNAADFVLYPNPATDKLNVMLSNEKSETVNIEVINGIGQTVKTVSFGNEMAINQIIDLNGLSNGIYFVKTTVGEKSVTKKLVIQ